MKKFVFIFALGLSGLVSANTISNDATKDVIVSETQFDKREDSKLATGINGFAAYETSCCGTCFVYGTYHMLGGGLYYFESASQATQATVLTPACTGEGSYLA